MTRDGRPDAPGRRDWHDDRPSTAVVAAVADAENASAADLPPLYDSVDPDALDEFVANDGANSRKVEFEFAGYEIVVEGDGTLSVEPAE